MLSDLVKSIGLADGGWGMGAGCRAPRWAFPLRETMVAPTRYSARS